MIRLRRSKRKELRIESIWIRQIPIIRILRKISRILSDRKIRIKRRNEIKGNQKLKEIRHSNYLKHNSVCKNSIDQVLSFYSIRLS